MTDAPATITIGFLLFPNVTQLDMTGPAQVLARVPGARPVYVWKTRDPVATDAGFSIVPTATFADCPPLDVLIVPGGAGTLTLCEDEETLSFLARVGATARHVCSVCNGSLVLGAAGLLEGYRSACHWAWREFLPAFGAVPDDGRVVRDRNRLSGGGVTAGIDFALTLAAELADEATARRIQLVLEYDPDPPFDSGTPAKAGQAMVDALTPAFAARKQAFAELVARRRAPS